MSRSRYWTLVLSGHRGSSSCSSVALDLVSGSSTSTSTRTKDEHDWDQRQPLRLRARDKRRSARPVRQHPNDASRSALPSAIGVFVTNVLAASASRQAAHSPRSRARRRRTSLFVFPDAFRCPQRCWQGSETGAIKLIANLAMKSRRGAPNLGEQCRHPGDEQ